MRQVPLLQRHIAVKMLPSACRGTGVPNPPGPVTSRPRLTQRSRPDPAKPMVAGGSAALPALWHAQARRSCAEIVLRASATPHNYGARLMRQKFQTTRSPPPQNLQPNRDSNATVLPVFSLPVFSSLHKSAREETPHCPASRTLRWRCAPSAPGRDDRSIAPRSDLGALLGQIRLAPRQQHRRLADEPHVV